MNKLLGCVALLVLVTTGAIAADMPLKARRLPPSPPAYHGWTGFYVGGNGGWAWQKDSGTSDFIQPGGFSPNPLSQSASPSKFIGGAQIGYNWQLARSWLLGVEGDWQWTNLSYTLPCRPTDLTQPNNPPCSNSSGFGFLTIGSSAQWLATARARVGWTWDRFVIYGTAGAAWARMETTLTADCRVTGGCGNSFAFNLMSAGFSDTKGGWTAGAGIESMLTPNWTAKVEWLHVDLGTVANALTLFPGDIGPQTVSWSRTVRFELLRFGVNYKFF